MKKLPKKFKEKWVKALRSGDYEQGKFYLKNSKGNYCCLGVACKISGQKDEDIMGIAYPKTIYNSIPKVPMFFKRPTELQDDMLHTLSKMNDRGGKSFDEIADYIEKNL